MCSAVLSHCTQCVCLAVVPAAATTALALVEDPTMPHTVSCRRAQLTCVYTDEQWHAGGPMHCLDHLAGMRQRMPKRIAQGVWQSPRNACFWEVRQLTRLLPCKASSINHPPGAAVVTGLQLLQLTHVVCRRPARPCVWQRMLEVHGRRHGILFQLGPRKRHLRAPNSCTAGRRRSSGLLGRVWPDARRLLVRVSLTLLP
jgi:hypothetical protein